MSSLLQWRPASTARVASSLPDFHMPRLGASFTAAAVSLAILSPWLSEMTPLDGAVAATGVVACTVGIIRSCTPTVRPTQLVLFGFWFSWLLVAPIYQVSHGVLAWADDALLLEASDVSAALLLSAAGPVILLVFQAGTGSQRPPEKAPAASDWTMPDRWRAVLLLIGAFAVTPFAIQASGGFSGLFTTRRMRAQVLAENGFTMADSGGIGFALTRILPAALAIAAVYVLLVRIRLQWRQGTWRAVSALDAHLFAAALALTLVHTNPLTNTRFLALSGLGSLMLLATQPRGKVGGAVTATVVMLGTLVVYPLLNYFRTPDRSVNNGLSALSSMDFDGFQQAINTFSYVSEEGMSYGRHLLSSIFFFVPRSIWGGKTEPATFEVARHRGYLFDNLSLPYGSEMYLQFGVVGFIGGMIALALLVRRLDSAWLLRPTSRAASMVPYLAISMVSIIRGPMGSLGPVYLTTAALIFLGLGASTGRRRSNAERGIRSSRWARPVPGRQ
jgi:hypothetical protein